ncbi:MAG: DUF1513 domain-containing protein [Hyphomicrobiaceae bacterium]|nr:DUF1513 domain-containing protein [Hyphomicrobiaceae bacterium]
METDRRSFLKGGAGLAASLLVSHAGAHCADATDLSHIRFISSARLSDGSYGLVFVSGAGRISRTIPLAARGHDITVSSDGRLAVAFARRPGTFAVAFDPQAATPPTVFAAPEDRHFYGHGVLSPDGRLLYATENDFDAVRGVLGIYDVGASFRRIGEIDTHGVEPHDLLLLSDGRTLCVANGGIETHPSTGRAKLNLDTMAPSLVFLDRETGDLLARHALPASLHQLSIRHLAADATGTVWMGGQWEGGMDAAPALVGSAGRDRQLVLVPATDGIGPDLKGYIGSVAASADGRIVAASAPRAGRTLFVDASTGRLVGERRIADGCGVAPVGGSMIAVSSGLGELSLETPGQPPALAGRSPGVSFDNHLILAEVVAP